MNTVPRTQCRYSPTTTPPLISRFFFTFFSILFFTFTSVVVADDDNAVYMSKLLKSITPTPTGWSPNIHFCKWNGVVCDQSGSVQVIKLPSSSLSGTLPYDIYTLSNLTHIDLHNNSLIGPFPFPSDTLQYAYLGHNNFTSIPDGFFQFLPALRALNLSNNLNLMPWVFPAEELISSRSLQTLDLEATNMIGSLPQEMFEGFPSLETLVLSHNNFTGTLPQSLSKSPIRYLRLNNQGATQLSGTIEVISSMRFLSQAWLNDNSFWGPIPDLSNCSHLFDLQLHSNALTGVVPPSLMALPSMNNVSLDNNFLQGPIPVFRKGVKATWKKNYFCRSDVGPCDQRVMTLLEISASFGFPDEIFLNSWLGNDPCMKRWEFIGCQDGDVVSVNLARQYLDGTISPAFANLTGLVNLTLSGNNLTGSIPQSLATLSQLQLLDVSDNNLSGQLPNFPSKVKLITIGNAFLGNISGRGGEKGASPSGDTPSGNPSKTSHTHSLRPFWIAGASVFCVGVAILIVIICKRKSYIGLVQKRIFKKTITLLDDNVKDFIKSYNLTVPKQYSYAEVKRITNSFRDKLGQGGYGVVYKASLPDGRQVAMKVIKEAKGNGEEFINEVASISRTSHVNIVSLLGFCYELNKRALIYEYMPNGSLDKFIYRSGFQSAICNLDWNTLYQIVIGIARGLEYLHQGCTSRILHLDIKPQNILLDEDFCPKISDFGLAKICQKKDSIVSIPGTRGTIGYMAPEVFSRAFGGVSHKSDVYSYGMLILEIIGGRKNHDTGGSHTTEMYFPDWIYKDLEQGNTHVNWLEISEEENDMVRKITMVSLWCIQTNPSERPSMKKVIEMLEGSLQSVPYPPKPVLYSPQRQPLQISYVSSNNLLETSSMTLQKNGSIKSNDFNNDKNENLIVS